VVAARRKKAEAPQAPAGDAAAELRHEVTRLRECVELLREALQNVPRADEFQPLADHLYELAQTTPKLVKSLQGMPQVVGPLEDGVRALEQVLVELPRAEDYEPLVGPLREFARVAPALIEQLALVMKSVAPLGDAVRQLRETAQTLRPGATAAAAPAASATVLEKAAQRMADAQLAIRDALASLPRDPEYRRVAEQLRAIASVSPSLSEWLHEVPKLSMPLGESIKALEGAATLLAEGISELRPQIAPARSTARRPRH